MTAALLGKYSVPAMSNKPMVPTAAAAPVANPLHPVRRHIGRPLGSIDDGQLRRALEVTKVEPLK